MITELQLSKALRFINVKHFSAEVGVSPYLVKKIRDGDYGSVSISTFKKVNDFFQGDEGVE